jgi:ion channel-forming bestrophin family protein
MLDYNPKEWFSFIFRFHKSDTVRQLFPMMLAIAAYSGLIAFLELEYWKLSANSNVKNIPVMHGMLGFVISMLLVFRTNTAYDRWWEARKLWGSLVNNSRNLALKVSAMLPEADNRKFYKKIISAYAMSLHQHLRAQKTRVELFEDLKDEQFLAQLQHDKHVPNQLAGMIIKKTNDLYKAGKLTGDQLIVLNSEVQSFTDVCGACERIKNTPIPYSYSVFLKKFIFFYIMTLPFGYVFNLGYYVIPVVTFIFYVLASLELIAEEIEDPFDGDTNDVPTEKISKNIHKHIHEILN